jgi:hypothetical protein
MWFSDVRAIIDGNMATFKVNYTRSDFCFYVAIIPKYGHNLATDLPNDHGTGDVVQIISTNQTVVGTATLPGLENSTYLVFALLAFTACFIYALMVSLVSTGQWFMMDVFLVAFAIAIAVLSWWGVSDYGGILPSWCIVFSVGALALAFYTGRS